MQPSLLLLAAVLAVLAALPVALGGEGSVLEYDRDGGIPQLEYTMRATKRGSTVVGVAMGTKGAVLACWDGKRAPLTNTVGFGSRSGGEAGEEKKEEKEEVEAAVEEVTAETAAAVLQYSEPSAWRLSRGQAMAATGLGGDARVLLKYARRLLQEHRYAFGSSSHSSNALPQFGLPSRRLAAQLAARVQSGTTTAGRRAFAVELLLIGAVASHPSAGCALFQVTPLGQLRCMRAVAIGAGAGAANKRLALLLKSSDAATAVASEGSEEEPGAVIEGIAAAAAATAAAAEEEEGGGGEEEEEEEENDDDGGGPMAVALEALLAAHANLPATGDAAAEEDGNRDESDASVGGGSSSEGSEGGGSRAVRTALEEMIHAAEMGRLKVLCLDGGVSQAAEATAAAAPASAAVSAGTTTTSAAVPSHLHPCVRSATPLATAAALRSLGKRRHWLP